MPRDQVLEGLNRKGFSFQNVTPILERVPYKVDLSLGGLPAFFKDIEDNETIEWSPAYQRGYVWTRQQQSSYVEWVLRQGDSSRDIHLNCPSWRGLLPGVAERTPVEVVDGKQRLTACFAFLNGEVEVFGKRIGEWTGSLSRLHVGLRIHVHDFTKRSELVRWYIAMNSGGTMHTEEDLERARSVLLQELEAEGVPQ